VVLLTHAPTAATRTAAFPADEPLDEPGLRAARSVTIGWHPGSDILRLAPSASCRETAAVLGLPDGVADPALRDADHGRWRGRSLDDVAVQDPAGVHDWLTDPDATPHGGEPVRALLARVASWLDALEGDARVVAVVGQAVVRAAVVHALRAPAAAFWRLDAAPLTRTDLIRGARGWTVRRTAERLPGRIRTAPAHPGKHPIKSGACTGD
jgi:broad specificity phosphatase PhoE